LQRAVDISKLPSRINEEYNDEMRKSGLCSECAFIFGVLGAYAVSICL